MHTRRPLMILATLALTAGCASQARVSRAETAWHQAASSDAAARAENARLRADLAKARADADTQATPVAPPAAPAPGSDLEALYTELVLEFETELSSGELVWVLDDEQVSLSFDDTLHFGTADAQLSDRGVDLVDRLATVLARHPDTGFQVRGHTDARPIATDRFPSNWELGAARASAVVRQLVDEGVDPDQLAVVSLADTEPIANGDLAVGQADNRRVDLVVVPSTAQPEVLAAVVRAMAEPTTAQPDALAARER
ncbi:MAG: OmpA family protein [Alphaproteobacteria bacterium]|nr:OmpA family protein [Alphaproteobacteria bacterium]